MTTFKRDQSLHMQPLEEKDTSPLEDTEITRLIKVSRELGYKKQDKIPERNLDHFKPISITQIASSLDQKVKELRNWSQPKRYFHNEISYNYRMDTIQAAALNVKLKYLKEWTIKRRRIASEYQLRLKNRKLEFF